MIVRMTAPAGSGHRVSSARLFLVTLWLAIATVMACALLPLGLPLTKTIGSAFSPATTAVALNARSVRLRVPGKALVSPRDDEVQEQTVFGPRDLYLSWEASQLTLSSGGRAIGPSVANEPSPAREPPQSPYPRGPPVL